MSIDCNIKARPLLKVLMLSWELPPHYVGGLGIVCDQLTRTMASQGADIEFVLPFYADYSHIKHMKVTPALEQDANTLMKSGGTYDSLRYEVTTTSGNKFTRSLYEQVEVFAQNVKRLAVLGDYDVIHAHDWLTLRAGIEAKRTTGLPLLAHVHATEYDRAGTNYGNPLIREIEYIGLHMADHIFAVSERTKQTLVEQYDIPKDKITVAYNVMDIQPSHLVEQEETYVYLQKMRTLGYKVVVNAGRMTIQKGVNNLVLAARKVLDNMPKTIFLFVGGGELIPELLELSASLNMSENVIFTGRVEGVGRQWRDCFKTADLYVMPSVSEPLGMVPLESIAYGAPTLISKQSGIAEILVNTLKVDCWDVKGMANKICGVLQNQDLHDELLQNAQTEHRLMSWAPTSEHIIETYSHVKRRMALA